MEVRKVTVREYLPSGVEIVTILRGRQVEIDRWLEKELSNPNWKYTVEIQNDTINIWCD